MTLHEEPIPSHVEPLFLKQLAGISQPWGFGPTEDEAWNVARVVPESKDALLDALARYDAELLDREKRARLEDLAAIRRENEVVGPNGLTLDDKTVARLTAAAVGLMIDQSRQEVRWEITRGQFVTMPRDTVLGLAVAAVNRVQACFDRVSDLTDAIMAAPDLAALEAINIETGWPV